MEMTPKRVKSLLSIASDSKTIKSQKDGYLTGILYMTPWKLDGLVNICPHASKGCAQACLHTAGRGQMSNVQASRLNKRLLWHKDKAWFLIKLQDEIKKLERKATRLGLKPLVRLNGTSDIVWETVAPRIFTNHPHIQFYDYTKIPKRGTKRPLPDNYHLTFSRSETNWDFHCREELSRGRSVAVVFDQVPRVWNGYRVVSGDDSDARHLDPGGVIVGLRAKGSARQDQSGFVVRLGSNPDRS